jgi:hypothetical protein
MESHGVAMAREVPDALGAAWDLTVEKWDEPTRHEEVMRLVAQHDAYAWAAARYRSRAGDPTADEQLERVRRAAEIAMLSGAIARKAGARDPYRNTMSLLIAMVVLILGGLLYAWVRFQGSGNEPTPPSVEGSDIG